METIVERPAALDVHKAQVTACVRTPAGGGRRESHFAEFATTVAGLWNGIMVACLSSTAVAAFTFLLAWIVIRTS